VIWLEDCWRWDFNGDGKADLAWRRKNDEGEVRIWLLDGGQLVQDIGLPVGDPVGRLLALGISMVMEKLIWLGVGKIRR